MIGLRGWHIFQQRKNSSSLFRIKAFTPATSFDDKTHAGKVDERILLYRLLYSYADLNPFATSLKWILKGNRGMRDENWEFAFLSLKHLMKANINYTEKDQAESL